MMVYHWCAEWRTSNTLHNIFFDAASERGASAIVEKWCEECNIIIPHNARLIKQGACWSITWQDSQERKHWLILVGPVSADQARASTLAWAHERGERAISAKIDTIQITLLKDFYEAEGEPFYPTKEVEQQQ